MSSESSEAVDEQTIESEPRTVKQPSASRRFFGNAAALLTSDMLNKATTFFVYVLVARSIDDSGEAFGQLVLGLTLFYVFQVLATAGLPNLLTREVATRPKLTPRLIAGGLAATCLTSCIAIFGMQFIAVALQFKEETTRVIQILSFGLVPYSLALIFEAAFRGSERMHFIAISNLLANIVKVGGAVVILGAGKGILWIAGLIVAVRTLIFVSDAICYLFVARYGVAKPIRAHVQALISRSIPFLGIDIVIALWGAVDGIFLVKLMSEAEVGIYGAAGQLLQPVALVYRSIVASVFPAMCRRASEHENLHVMTRWMVAFLLLIGLPVTILLAAFADLVLYWVYGEPQFQAAVPVMRIAAFGLIAHSFTSILGHALWASGREKDTLRIVLINFLVNVLISYLFISWWGLIGAPIASLCVVALNVVQHYEALRRVVPERPLDRQVLVPLVAAAAMLLVLVLITPLNRYLAALVASAIYALVATGLLVGRHGGAQNLRSGFFSPLVH